MTQELENVIVERISLVSNEATPAVPKAETRFALFKALPKRLHKLKVFFENKKTDKQESLIKILESNKYKLSDAWHSVVIEKKHTTK